MTRSYLEIDKNRNFGAYSINQGFNFTFNLCGENKMHNAESFINKS